MNVAVHQSRQHHPRWWRLISRQGPGLKQTSLMPGEPHRRQPLFLDCWQGRRRVEINQPQGNPSLKDTTLRL